MRLDRTFVAGAGMMGHGIAQALAATGRHVTLYEPDLVRANAGRDRIAENLARSVAKGRLTEHDREAILERIRPTNKMAGARDAALVVEAVFEDVAVKTALWSGLDGLAPAHAIFATNTSSISIDRLADAVELDRRARFIGMHFFSPVPVMPLIEVVRGAATSDATDGAVRDLADRLGKQRHRHPRTGPGFIVNRIGSCRSWPRRCAPTSRSVATADDIDARRPARAQPPDGAARAGRLHRPRRLPQHHGVLDEGFGGDAVCAAAGARRAWSRPGHLGRKTGRGFHVYPRP